MRRSNLSRHLGRVEQVVERLPQAAATELDALQQATQAAQRAPDGQRWKRTVRDHQPFDRFNAIRYAPAVLPSGSVVLQARHPAARHTRWGTKFMAARPKVPTGDGLGWWLPRILRALRRWSQVP